MPERVKRDLKFWLSAAVLGASIVAGYATLRAQVATSATAIQELKRENREEHIDMQRAILDIQRSTARIEGRLEDGR